MPERWHRSSENVVKRWIPPTRLPPDEFENVRRRHDHLN
jgi:hypothetical protein